MSTPDELAKIHASDENSAEAAAAVESISKPTGTTAPDASAASEHTAESQLRSADAANTDPDNVPHYPELPTAVQGPAPDEVPAELPGQFKVTEPEPTTDEEAGKAPATTEAE